MFCTTVHQLCGYHANKDEDCEEWCLLGCYAVKTSNLTKMKIASNKVKLRKGVTEGCGYLEHCA
jgi:hypothetical protein